MTWPSCRRTRYQFLETKRIPVAVIGAMFFPAASMAFFVVPFTGDNPVAATYATASMVVFATSTTCLFQYGIGVSEDRTQPWDPYVRTLPAGALPPVRRPRIAVPDRRPQRPAVRHRDA